MLRPGENRSPAEAWRDVAMAWADAEDAAQMLEETKSAVLSQMVAAEIASDPKMSNARAEMNVKSSDKWRRHVVSVVRARTAANKARIERDYHKMKFSQWISDDANHRAGSRMGS
jgi:hypothetical protein